jgi:outer membrane protein X
MKKITSVLVFFFAFVIAHAQSTTFRPFKFDIALGYAIPGGSGAKGGLIVAAEPKYAINDNITVGLRAEAAVMARAVQDPSTGEVTAGEVKASGSYLLTGDYYFNTNSFRPFAGLGAGIFTLAGGSADINGNTTVVAAANKFGFTPRVGFEAGHFRTALEYNVVGKTGTMNNNYLGIKIGFFIGGGRLKK